MVTTSDPKPLRIDATDPALRGDGDDYDRDVRSAGAIYDELERLKAELAAMKAGMVNRVGQRLFNKAGVLVTITECLPYDVSHRWVGTMPGDLEFTYDDAGRCSVGDQWPSMNLVGPAPDELAEAKKEAQRIAERNRELIAQFAQYRRLHELSPGDDVRELPEIVDDGTKDVCFEVRRRIEAEIPVVNRGKTFYAKVAMRQCEFLPLNVTGNVGEVSYEASYLPGISFRGEGLTAVYEVEVI